MCLICTELDKKNITPWEARENLEEMSENIGSLHFKEVKNRIFEEIFEQKSTTLGHLIKDHSKFCEICDYFPCECDWGLYE